jgi:hypothetical protein
MRASKRSATTLVRVAILVLIGRWLDLYLMIVPAQAPDQPPFGAWEIGPLVAVVALGLLAFFHYVRQAPVVPLRDPLLAESIARPHRSDSSRTSPGSFREANRTSSTAREFR